LEKQLSDILEGVTSFNPENKKEQMTAGVTAKKFAGMEVTVKENS
jgi:hypothetical protein